MKKNALLTACVVVTLLLSAGSTFAQNTVDWRYGRPGVLVVTNAPSRAELSAAASAGTNNASRISGLSTNYTDASNPYTPASAFTWSTNASGATVTGFTGSQSHVRVPPQYLGLPVVKIGDNAFSGKSSVTSFTLPDTLRDIGATAFNQCSSARTYVIPASVTNIGVFAFYYIQAPSVYMLGPPPVAGDFGGGGSGTVYALAGYGYGATLGGVAVQRYGPDLYLNSNPSNFITAAASQGLVAVSASSSSNYTSAASSALSNLVAAAAGAGTNYVNSVAVTNGGVATLSSASLATLAVSGHTKLGAMAANSAGVAAFGSMQAGFNDSLMASWYVNALGSWQIGYTGEETGIAVTNLGTGAVQIFSLNSPNQKALTTAGGAGSLMLGAGVSSNKHALVVGDGAFSHGAGSITAAGGFWGSGIGLTDIRDALAITNLSSPTLTGLALQRYTNAIANAYTINQVSGAPASALGRYDYKATSVYTNGLGWQIYVESSPLFVVYVNSLPPLGSGTYTFMSGAIPRNSSSGGGIGTGTIQLDYAYSPAAYPTTILSTNGIEGAALRTASVPPAALSTAPLYPTGDGSALTGITAAQIVGAYPSSNVTASLSVPYTVPIATNIFSNGGYETWTGAAPAGWTFSNGGSNGTIAKEQNYVTEGTNAVKLTRGESTAWYAPQISINASVVPNQPYTLSLWSMGNGTNSGFYALYDNTNARYITYGGGTSIGPSATNYTQFVYNFTSPAGCASLSIYLTAGAGAGASTWFDAVHLDGYYAKQMNGVTTSLKTLLDSFPATGVRFDNSSNGMTSTSVQAAIVEAYNRVPSSLNLTPRVLLPQQITAVVGEELQVFTRGSIEAQNPYNMPYSFNSTLGYSYPRFYSFTPVTNNVGTNALNVYVYDLARTAVATGTTGIVTVNPVGSPASNITVVCIGDSLTAGGTWPLETYRRLTQAGGTPVGREYTNITFLGDVPLSGFATQGFTAWGGWSFGYHMGSAVTNSGYVLTGTFDKDRADVNAYYAYGTSQYRIMTTDGRLQVMLYSGSDVLPASGTLTWVSGGAHTSDIVYTSRLVMPGGSVFWDTSSNGVNFTTWRTRVGGAGRIDVAYILLGWNELGTGPLAADHAAAITSAKAMIDKLHVNYPNCKVRLLGVQVPSFSGGLGTNYGANGGLSDFYNTLRNANGYNLAMASIAAESGYSSFVRYLGIASQFDSEYNMPHTTYPVNSRNSATEDRQTNGVHPTTPGYYQIADVVYRDFIRSFCVY